MKNNKVCNTLMHVKSCEHPSDDEIFMNMTREFSRKSHCISQKVAAMAVLDGCPIAMGRNGTVKGEKNCCDAFSDRDFTREEHHEWSNHHESHAEINLLKDATRRGVSLIGTTIYVTLQPCSNCSKALTDIGIVRVVYGEEYTRTPVEASNVLMSSGVVLEFLDIAK